MQYEFEFPEGFFTGAVGLPGNRTFFIQGGDAFSFKCEKQQVLALARYFELLLNPSSNQTKDLLQLGLTGEIEEGLELTTEDPPENYADCSCEPDDLLWSVGDMSVKYNPESEVLELSLEKIDHEEMLDDPHAEGQGLAETKAEKALFVVNKEQMQYFVFQAKSTISKSRPPCKWCNSPLNYSPDEFCPCWN